MSDGRTAILLQFLHLLSQGLDLVFEIIHELLFRAVVQPIRPVQRRGLRQASHSLNTDFSCQRGKSMGLLVQSLVRIDETLCLHLTALSLQTRHVVLESQYPRAVLRGWIVVGITSTT